MKIQQILSQRSHILHTSLQLVYEWEDVLSRALGCPIADDVSIENLLYRIGRRFFPFVEPIAKTDVPSFVFAMSPNLSWGNDKPNIVPCIIDYFLRDRSRVKWFFRRHAKNPAVLISSREAYEFLRAQGRANNLRHWALSIADGWVERGWEDGEKRFDAVIVGRENPVLRKYLDRYASEHSDFDFVASTVRDGRRVYASSRDGEILNGSTHEDYMRIMRMSKCGLYATPGLEGANPEANGFNQVTPRFLEYLASGCHVIARYPKNADTEFYEMDKMALRADTYDQFAQAMDFARNNPIDSVQRKSYLSKHVTSQRAVELKQILATL